MDPPSDVGVLGRVPDCLRGQVVHATVSPTPTALIRANQIIFTTTDAPTVYMLASRLAENPNLVVSFDAVAVNVIVEETSVEQRDQSADRQIGENTETQMNHITPISSRHLVHGDYQTDSIVSNGIIRSSVAPPFSQQKSTTAAEAVNTLASRLAENPDVEATFDAVGENVDVKNCPTAVESVDISLENRELPSALASVRHSEIQISSRVQSSVSDPSTTPNATHSTGYSYYHRDPLRIHHPTRDSQLTESPPTVLISSRASQLSGTAVPFAQQTNTVGLTNTQDSNTFELSSSATESIFFPSDTNNSIDFNERNIRSTLKVRPQPANTLGLSNTNDPFDHDVRRSPARIQRRGTRRQTPYSSRASSPEECGRSPPQEATVLHNYTYEQVSACFVDPLVVFGHSAPLVAKHSNMSNLAVNAIHQSISSESTDAINGSLAVRTTTSDSGIDESVSISSASQSGNHQPPVIVPAQQADIFSSSQKSGPAQRPPSAMERDVFSPIPSTGIRGILKTSNGQASTESEVVVGRLTVYLGFGIGRVFTDEDIHVPPPEHRLNGESPEATDLTSVSSERSEDSDDYDVPYEPETRCFWENLLRYAITPEKGHEDDGQYSEKQWVDHLTHKALNIWYFDPAKFNKKTYPFPCGGFVVSGEHKKMMIFTRRLGPIALDEDKNRRGRPYIFFMVVGHNDYRALEYDKVQPPSYLSTKFISLENVEMRGFALMAPGRRGDPETKWFAFCDHTGWMQCLLNSGKKIKEKSYDWEPTCQVVQFQAMSIDNGRSWKIKTIAFVDHKTATQEKRWPKEAYFIPDLVVLPMDEQPKPAKEMWLYSAILGDYVVVAMNHVCYLPNGNRSILATTFGGVVFTQWEGAGLVRQWKAMIVAPESIWNTGDYPLFMSIAQALRVREWDREKVARQRLQNAQKALPDADSATTDFPDMPADAP